MSRVLIAVKRGIVILLLLRVFAAAVGGKFAAKTRKIKTKNAIFVLILRLFFYPRSIIGIYVTCTYTCRKYSNYSVCTGCLIGFKGQTLGIENLFCVSSNFDLIEYIISVFSTYVFKIYCENYFSHDRYIIDFRLEILKRIKIRRKNVLDQN